MLPSNSLKQTKLCHINFTEPTHPCQRAATANMIDEALIADGSDNVFPPTSAHFRSQPVQNLSTCTSRLLPLIHGVIYPSIGQRSRFCWPFPRTHSRRLAIESPITVSSWSQLRGLDRGTERKSDVFMACRNLSGISGSWKKDRSPFFVLPENRGVHGWLG